MGLASLSLICCSSFRNSSGSRTVTACFMGHLVPVTYYVVIHLSSIPACFPPIEVKISICPKCIRKVVFSIKFVRKQTLIGHNIEFSTRPASERHHPDLLRKRVYSSEFCLEYCNDLLRGSISKSRSLDQMKRFYDLSLRLSYSLWYFSWIMFRSKVQKASNIASNSTWLK